MAMPQFYQSSYLLSLPDILLNQIVSLLKFPRDISAICQTSHRLNLIGDPLLHRDILFEEPERHVTFLNSLATRPRRGSLVQNVRVEYPGSGLSEFLGSDDSGYPIDRFSHSISTMTNLASLTVSVPEGLLSGIGHVFNGPFDLPSLKSCTLFYQCENQNYWDLRENIHVFSHPSLQHLTIRRARLDYRGYEFFEKPPKTALQTLQFLECDISGDGFYDIMMLPNDLKEITITQLEFPDPPLEEAPESVGDYMSAMTLAQNSLESVVINFPVLTASRPMQLRDYSSLTHLELRDYQLFGQAAPRLVSVGLPSNLETLKFFGQVGKNEEISELLCMTIENKEVLASKWARIILDGYGDPPPDIVKACEKFEGFLVTKKQVMREIVDSNSVISEISTPKKEDLGVYNGLRGSSEIMNNPSRQQKDVSSSSQKKNYRDTGG